MKFERFDVEEGNSSNFDLCENVYLDVYDETNVVAPLVGKLCGRIAIPEKIQSIGETLLLQFVTNDHVTGHGFRLRYSIQNRTCGGLLTLTKSKQVLQSPNYPNGYEMPQQCSWSFGQSYMYMYILSCTYIQ